MSIKDESNKNVVYKIIKLHLYKRSIYIFIIFSYLNNVLCDDNDSKNRTKTIIIFILIIVAIVVIIILMILFIICICCKKRNDDRNNYIEGSNIFERGSQREIDLRDRVNIEGIQALSNYLKDELITDIYTKKFEIFMNKCPICLDNFTENKSTIIISGCLHIFHEKCLCVLAEKIDLNKNIFAQYTCPTCRNNLLDGIDKIKACLEIDPNFFDDIYKNKKINKMKHVKNIIEKMLNENMNKKKREESSNEKIKERNVILEKNKNDNENDNDYKDISFDNIVIQKSKKNIRRNFEDNDNKNEIINNKEPV